MAGRSLALLAAALVLLAAPGAHANEAMFPGCTPCSSCTNAWCWRICRPSCGFGPFTPNNVIVSGDSCRASGAGYGPTAGASACNQARSRCSALMGSVGASYGAAPIGGVTLSQCSSIALGACQQGANLDSCGGAAQVGYGSCSAFQFRQYFSEAAESICRGYAISVTDVNPGTNSWVVPPYVPPYQPEAPVYPYVIGAGAPTIGGSIVGDAPVVVGSAAPSAEDGSSGDSDSSDGGRRRLMGAGRRMLRGL